MWGAREISLPTLSGLVWASYTLSLFYPKRTKKNGALFHHNVCYVLPKMRQISCRLFEIGHGWDTAPQLTYAPPLPNAVIGWESRLPSRASSPMMSLSTIEHWCTSSISMSFMYDLSITPSVVIAPYHAATIEWRMLQRSHACHTWSLSHVKSIVSVSYCKLWCYDRKKQLGWSSIFCYDSTIGRGNSSDHSTNSIQAVKSVAFKCDW